MDNNYHRKNNSSEARARRRRREQIRRRNRIRIIRAIIVLLICVILCGVLLIKLFACASDAVTGKSDKAKAKANVEKTITIGSAGDIILHKPFLQSTYISDGEYDYSSCFKYIEGDYNADDFMVANLETTLAGKDRSYTGYPAFNSPDVIASNLTNSGVDLMLLANNHIYDTGKSGFLRTSQYLADNDFLYTGARHSDEEKKYVIKKVDGIKVGFINYVYETKGSGKSINANIMDSSVAPYLNSFDPNNLSAFYEEFQEQYDAMRADGAEFIIFYPHWGNEYQLEECSYQREMAQKLCDIGVDAIIGGHPHVVQPVDVFTSEDSNHKMFCAFSMGNQLSNQRRAYVPLSTGNTEDGIIVNLTIRKNAKGKVKLKKVECIPTWVYMTGERKYYIIPADNPESVEEETGISGIGGEVKASYDRTHKIIDPGMEKVNEAFN